MEGIGTQFEIEWAGWVAGERPVVIARVLAAGDFNFEVGDGATLGGCPLTAFVDMPRIPGPDGLPRLDVFAFELADPADLGRFGVGQVVTLFGGPAPLH